MQEEEKKEGKKKEDSSIQSEDPAGKEPAYDKPPSLSPETKKELLHLAREAISTYIKTGKMPKATSKNPELEINSGAFVTLKKGEALRGCIGHMKPRLPLGEAIPQLAFSSAFDDFRFSGLPTMDEKELAAVIIEISLLSLLKKAKDYREIEMGKHGVILSQGGHYGVFLPQVATETGWSRDTFLTRLCTGKAGLPPDAWEDPKTEILTFVVDKFSDR